MSSIFDIIRRTVISPEFLVTIFAILIIILKPNFLLLISKALSEAPDGVKYIALVPVGITFWCLKQSKTILFPSEDAQGLLQNWPNFRYLKTRVLIGIVYQGFFCVSGVLVWITVPKFDNYWSVVVIGMAIIGSVVGAATFYLASLNVAEMTKRHTL